AKRERFALQQLRQRALTRMADRRRCSGFARSLCSSAARSPPPRPMPKTTSAPPVRSAPRAGSAAKRVSSRRSMARVNRRAWARPAVDQSLPPQQQSQAHVERALQLIALGRMTQAKASLDDAVRTDPRNLMAHKLRARSKIPGNLSEAEADINAGLLLDPDD